MARLRTGGTSTTTTITRTATSQTATSPPPADAAAAALEHDAEFTHLIAALAHAPGTSHLVQFRRLWNKYAVSDGVTSSLDAHLTSDSSTGPANCGASNAHSHGRQTTPLLPTIHALLDANLRSERDPKIREHALALARSPWKLDLWRVFAIFGSSSTVTSTPSSSSTLMNTNGNENESGNGKMRGSIWPGSRFLGALRDLADVERDFGTALRRLRGVRAVRTKQLEKAADPAAAAADFIVGEREEDWEAIDGRNAIVSWLEEHPGSEALVTNRRKDKVRVFRRRAPMKKRRGNGESPGAGGESGEEQEEAEAGELGGDDAPAQAEMGEEFRCAGSRRQTEANSEGRQRDAVVEKAHQQQQQLRGVCAGEAEHRQQLSSASEAEQRRQDATANDATQQQQQGMSTGGASRRDEDIAASRAQQEDDMVTNGAEKQQQQQQQHQQDISATGAQLQEDISASAVEQQQQQQDMATSAPEQRPMDITTSALGQPQQQQQQQHHEDAPDMMEQQSESEDEDDDDDSPERGRRAPVPIPVPSREHHRDSSIVAFSTPNGDGDGDGDDDATSPTLAGASRPGRGSFCFVRRKQSAAPRHRLSRPSSSSSSRSPSPSHHALSPLFHLSPPPDFLLPDEPHNMPARPASPHFDPTPKAAKSRRTTMSPLQSALVAADLKPWLALWTSYAHAPADLIVRVAAHTSVEAVAYAANAVSLVLAIPDRVAVDDEAAGAQSLTPPAQCYLAVSSIADATTVFGDHMPRTKQVIEVVKELEGVVSSYGPLKAHGPEERGALLHEDTRTTFVHLPGPRTAALVTRMGAAAALLATGQDVPDTLPAPGSWERYMRLCASFFADGSGELDLSAFDSDVDSVVSTPARPANMPAHALLSAPFIALIDDIAARQSRSRARAAVAQTLRQHLVRILKADAITTTSPSSPARHSQQDLLVLDEDINQLTGLVERAKSIVQRDLLSQALAEKEREKQQVVEAQQQEADRCKAHSNIERARKKLISVLASDKARYEDEIERFQSQIDSVRTSWVEAVGKVMAFAKGYQGNGVDDEVGD